MTTNEVSVNEPTGVNSSSSDTSAAPTATSPALEAAKLKADAEPEVLEPIVEVKGITLFSLTSNLQTSLLANLISSQTGLPCAVETDYTPRLSHTTLASDDCQGHSLEALQGLVRNIQNHKLQSGESELRTVLLNAAAESEHEELLDWPCIVGVFFDDTDQDQLTRGLQCLLEGEYWVPRRLLHLFLQKNRRAPNAQKLDIKLTKRERQILKLIKDGATNSDIAKVLEVSEHTVKSHLYNVYKKIGVRNRLEANNWVRDMDSL